MDKKQEAGAPKDRSRVGIPELDETLGGGFPKGAVILLSGNSGTGKTILSLQWLFNGAKKYDETGIYITFTEPIFKTMKNLEKLSFYDRALIENEKIKILDVRRDLQNNEFVERTFLDTIEAEVKKNDAQRLIIDSITAIAASLGDNTKIRKFIFDLGTMLATLGCTTILTSEVSDANKYSVYGVEEFISDGILITRQEKQKSQTIRTLETPKMRGIVYQSGPNPFKITADGIRLFPYVSTPLQYAYGTKKMSIGVLGFDEMCLGGLMEGSTTLLAGSTGTGKSVLSMHFIWEGLKKGEQCLLVSFEESRDQIVGHAKSFGFDFETHEKKGLLKILCAYPTEKYLEEHLSDIKVAIDSMKVKRCVIDSLSALESSFEDDRFRNFAKQLLAYLKFNMITTFLTAATANLMATQELTGSDLSTMTDNIILLKYVESIGEMRLMATLLKTRGGDHDRGLRGYSITQKGIVVGESFKGFENVLSGSARKVSSTTEELLDAEFRRFIGPMAPTVYAEVKQSGLSVETVFKYIDDLKKQGILAKENAQSFKQNVANIMGKGFEMLEQAPQADKKSEQKSFVKKLFGG